MLIDNNVAVIYRAGGRDRETAPRRQEPFVPGYSHYNLITSEEVPQIVGKFLADPLTNPPSGATAASQAAPGPDKTK
jgi:hypothetical protein